MIKETDWIPFELREMDEEEKEYYNEYYDGKVKFMLCCELPDEDEEILVSYASGYVGEDIFLRDEYGWYLDSGMDLGTEAIAWMHKPKPYKPSTENRCVCCGDITPEGRQVCKKCELEYV